MSEPLLRVVSVRCQKCGHEWEPLVGDCYDNSRPPIETASTIRRNAVEYVHAGFESLDLPTNTPILCGGKPLFATEAVAAAKGEAE